MLRLRSQALGLPSGSRVLPGPPVAQSDCVPDAGGRLYSEVNGQFCCFSDNTCRPIAGTQTNPFPAVTPPPAPGLPITPITAPVSTGLPYFPSQPPYAPSYGAYGYSPYGATPYGTSYTTYGSGTVTFDPVLLLGLGAVALFFLTRSKDGGSTRTSSERPTFPRRREREERP